MYARPIFEEAPLRFGVSGRLWREALVPFDRQTGTLWSQRTHRALAGPLAGTELEVVPSEITSWGSWRRRHPETTLVSPGQRASSIHQQTAQAILVVGLGGMSILFLRSRRRWE